MKETIIHKMKIKLYHIYYRFRILILEPMRNWIHVIKIRFQSRPVNVAFFAMSLSLWRYQRVFEIMQRKSWISPVYRTYSMCQIFARTTKARAEPTSEVFQES